MIFGPHRGPLASVVEADRRSGRSGISICGLHGMIIGETCDMAGNLKTLKVKSSPFQHIQPASASMDHFLDTKELYYASTCTKIGVEI